MKQTTQTQTIKTIEYYDGMFIVLLVDGQRPILQEDIKTIDMFTIEERDEIRATIKADLIARGLFNEEA